jgi:serine/threonine protein kinase
MQNLQLNRVKDRLLFLSPKVEGRIERELNTRDFEAISMLGQGAFGKVYKVRNKIDGGIYALKQISKGQIK